MSYRYRGPGARVSMGVRAELARQQGCVPNAGRQVVHCAYCGAAGTLTWTQTGTQPVGRVHSTLDWDHVVPVVHGGTSGADNVVLACTPCNMRKGSRSAAEFAEGVH